MVEIEFLDPGPEDFPAADPASGPRPDSRRALALRRARSFAPAVLWAGAAGLAAAAPFRVIDTITIRNQGETQLESTDGWGRYRSGGGVSFISHGPRYGAILVACAAILLAAAVLSLLPTLRRPAGSVLPRIRTALGVAGAGGLAALLAVLVLNFLSTRDTLAAQVKSFGSSAPGTLVSEVFTARVRLGACLWLAVAALGCALLAIAADLTAPAPVPPTATGDEQFAPEPPLHPQDDLLESGPAA